MDPRISNLRQEYAKAALDEQSVSPDPIYQFKSWFNQALEAGVLEPNAMTLSTADASGMPSGRIMLLKDVDAAGFTFFTNYESRKGQQLDGNPFAALTFWWEALERQVRVEGRVARIDERESDLYYASRPRASQLGAWASPQSRVVSGRDEMEARLEQLEEEYGLDIPRPKHWGGYRVEPEMIEFWQGRQARLHDRIRYQRHEGNWRIERLAP